MCRYNIIYTVYGVMNAFIIYFLYLKYHFKYVVSLKCLLQLKFNVSIFFTTLCTLLVNLKKKRDFFCQT